MEVELYMLVKEKEQSVQMVFIPLDTVSLTRVSTTTITTTTEIPSPILVKVPDASEKLLKSMEDMSLQGEEIRKFKEELNILQDLKSMFEANYNTQMHKSQRLSHGLQKL
jgi:hypothetical protein